MSVLRNNNSINFLCASSKYTECYRIGRGYNQRDAVRKRDNWRRRQTNRDRTDKEKDRGSMRMRMDQRYNISCLTVSRII